MNEFDRYHRQAVERAEKEGRMPPLPPLRPLRGKEFRPEEDLFEPRYFAPSRNNITRSSLKPNGTPGLLAATAAISVAVSYLTYRQMYKPSRVPANYDQSNLAMCQKKYGPMPDHVVPINTVVSSGKQQNPDAQYGPDAGKSLYYTRNKVNAAEPAYTFRNWHAWETPLVKREQAMEKGEEIIRSLRDQ